MSEFPVVGDVDVANLGAPHNIVKFIVHRTKVSDVAISHFGTADQRTCGQLRHRSRKGI